MIKANIIEGILTWFYVIPTVLGLFLIPIQEIFSKQIPDRLFESNLIYLIILLFSIICAIYLFKLLTQIGKHIAKKKWQPEIIEGLFKVVKEIENHDLLEYDFTRAKFYIEKIEKALDIEPCDSDLYLRFNNIRNIFYK